MKILHVVDSFQLGGMESGVVKIINLSDSSQFKHAICSLRQNSSMYKKINNKDTVALFELNMQGTDRFCFMKIYSVLTEFCPDAVHIRNWGPLFDVFLAVRFYRIRHKCKLLFSFHGRSYCEYDKQESLRQFIRKIILKSFDGICTLNQHMANELFCEYGLENIRIIGNGVDVDKFKPNKKARKDRKLLSELKIKPSDFVLGTVSRLDKIKNIGYLIVAFSEICRGCQDVKFIIAGSGDEIDNLKKLVLRLELLDKVFFLGQVDNIGAFLQELDVYVQSSLYEGFSNTVIEAQSSGLPVVCSDVGGNSSLVCHGKDGFLFNLDNVASFISQIETLYSDSERRVEMGRCARQKAIIEWSIENMANNYSDLYCE